MHFQKENTNITSNYARNERFFDQTLDFLPIRHFEKYLGPVFLSL